MTAPSTAELEHLAQTYATSTAVWLSFAVHQRDKTMIDDLIGRLGIQELRALTVVLASQIPRPRSRPDDGVVDEVAVQRVAAGDDYPLTGDERAACVRLMHRRGATFTEIARRLHMTNQSVRKVTEAAA